MLALGRLLGGGGGGDRDDRDRAADRATADAVQSLLHRVQESAILEDRREAMAQLRDLLAADASAAAAFGAAGFAVALAAVRERDDLDTVRAALEAVSLATALDGWADAPAPAGAPPHPRAANAAQLARTRDALPLLLALLEPPPRGAPDFYCRLHALQALGAAAAAAPAVATEAVLGAHMGVPRLVDMLAGGQEALRNEAALLLGRLAAGSEDVRKAAAFGGAFDRLLAIVREEGGLEGGVVVADCLGCVAALLRGSPGGQLLFREAGHLGELPRLLAPPAPGGGGALGAALADGAPPERNWGAVAAALQAVDALLEPAADGRGGADAAAAAANAAALLQEGLLPVLAPLAVDRGACLDAGARAAAMRCLTSLAAGGAATRDALAVTTAAVGGGRALPLPAAALLAAEEAADVREAAAADAFLETYCAGNAAGVAALCSTLAPAAPPGAFGAELLRALGRPSAPRAHVTGADVASAGAAAAALAHLAAAAPELHDRLLTLRLPRGGPPVMAAAAAALGAAVTFHGGAPGSPHAALCLARLLLPWLWGRPPAVGAFLAAVTETPFLVGLVLHTPAHAAGAALRGAAALLLGACAAFAPADAPTGRDALRGVITGRIGLPQFVAALDGLAAHPALRQPGRAAAVPGPAVVLSPAAAAQLADFDGRVRALFCEGAPPPAPPLAQQQQYQQQYQQPQQQYPPPTQQHYGAPAAASPAAAALPPAPPPAPPPALPPYQPASPSAARPPASAAGPHFALAPPNAFASQAAVFSPGGGHGGGAAAAAAPVQSWPAPVSPPAQRWPPPVAAGVAAGGAAAAAAAALQHEVERLRAENWGLSQDLARASAAGGPGGAAALAAQQQQHALGAAEARAQQAEAGLADARRRVAELEGAAAAARAEAADARAAAARAEADLEALSAAYATLEAQAGAPPPPPPSGAGVDEAEVARRVAAARAEAEEEAAAGVEDLLVCLGREEAKAARLADELRALGVDPEPLLAEVEAAGE